MVFNIRMNYNEIMKKGFTLIELLIIVAIIGILSAVGIPISLTTMFTARVKEEKDVAPALKRLLIIATALSAVVMYFVSMWALPESFEISGELYTNMDVFLSYLTGAVAGLLVGLLTEYYTSHDFKPVQEVAKASETGAATNIIFGLALGYQSAAGSILLLAASIFILLECMVSRLRQSVC